MSIIERTAIASVLGLVLSAAGCSKPAAEEPAADPAVEEPESAEADEEPQTAEAEEPQVPGEEALPIPEDYAEEAAAEITKDNYTEQLAAMEKDLAETQ